MLTYRFVGHSRSDPGAYRKPGELEEWQARDPLIIARQRLSEGDGVDESEFERIEKDVQDEIDAVVERSLSAPWPDPEDAVTEFKAS